MPTSLPSCLPLLFLACLALLAMLATPAPSLCAQSPPKLESQLQRVALAADQLLRDELHQSWYPRTVRPEGGFHQNFANDWTPLPDPSYSLVAQARHVWTTSRFAQYSPQDRTTYLAHAAHGYRFLSEAFSDPKQGGLFWSITQPNQPAEGHQGIKHVYGIAFAIYAAVAYHEASHDPAPREFASQTFDWLEQFAHDPTHGGYREQFTANNQPMLDFRNNSPMWERTDPLGVYFGYKSMNTHIHLLEAFSELSKIDQRPIVRQRLEEVLTIVRDRIAVEPGVLCLFFTQDWRPTAAHDSFGHDIETAYLLVEAAEKLHTHADAKTWAVARQLVDHALEWGWDEQHGGFYDKGEAFSTAFDTDKVWWVQAEGLNVLALLHLQFGHETDRYAQALLKQWDFIEQHAIDRQHLGWFNETTREGSPTGSPEKSNAWKCSYHTSRALMNVATLLRPKPAQRTITP